MGVSVVLPPGHQGAGLVGFCHLKSMSSQVVIVYLVRGLYCFRYVASKVHHEQHDNMKV